MKKKRAKKSFDKFFENYTWAKDETPAEGDEQRKALGGQVVRLYKARNQLKPSDPRHTEATRLLAIMRQKSKEAAEREGRYTKKAVTVDEAEAAIEESTEKHKSAMGEAHGLVGRLLRVAVDLAKMKDNAQEAQKETAAAGRAGLKVANELLAGEPDEPMPEWLESDMESLRTKVELMQLPTKELKKELKQHGRKTSGSKDLLAARIICARMTPERQQREAEEAEAAEEPAAKRPRTDPGAASGAMGGDERAGLMAQSLAKLKELCTRNGLPTSGTKAKLVDRLVTWGIVVDTAKSGTSAADSDLEEPCVAESGPDQSVVVTGETPPPGADNRTPLVAESLAPATESDAVPQTEEPAAQTQERVSTDTPSATAYDVSEGEALKPSTTLRACGCTGYCDSRCPDYKGFGVRPRCLSNSYNAVLARIKGPSYATS